MDAKWKAQLILISLLVVASMIFCAGITWGLPSRDIDKYLFGNEPVWSGQKIQELAGDWSYDPDRGADVDIDPLKDRNQIICLNQTDQQRAEIIRRYRLYSYQPDEMITFRSLASMKPSEGDFDPRLYQYGGLWIYPVGILLKLASACGAIILKSDVAHYLDNPEQFGRFYVVARLYVVAWALLGVWAVFAIVRRLTDGCLVPATFASLCYMVMPVVINMAHEAKPHLPGAVLMLLAVMSAIRYVDKGKRKWWIITACLCGAALGMVLSSLPIFVILPVMVFLRKQSWRDRVTIIIVGILIGVGVYLITNPYIAINVFINREVLQSNLSNSMAMYEISRLSEGLLNAAGLVAEGTSTLLAIAGAVGAICLSIRALKNRVAASGWLLAAPAILILLQFIALAAGKPGEYGRFAILPDIALGIAAVVAIYTLVQRAYVKRLLLGALVLFTALSGSGYVSGFILDSSPNSSRIQTARKLEQFQETAADSIGILCEPAPYVLPPVDLFHWRLLLLPSNIITGKDEHPDLLIHTLGLPDYPMGFAPSQHYKSLPQVLIFYEQIISWANKVFHVQKKKELSIPGTQRADVDAD
ncbi:MAG: ArnT family glycosyltransferase [Planctomycetota bacterium]|jgi:hypothetical protein